MTAEIAIRAIRADASAQPRENLSYDVVSAYAEDMKAGAEFPAVMVFEDAATAGSVYWLADGFHRHAAADQAQRATIMAEVRPGTLRDAILYSVGANAKHGLQRSNEDKRRAVRRLLDDTEWSSWSNREIARRCLVDDKTVASVRAEQNDHLRNSAVSTRTVSRGGRTYEMDVGRLRSSPRVETLPPEPGDKLSSIERAAELMDVSVQDVRDAQEVWRRGSPEIADDVWRGRCELPEAVRVVRAVGPIDAFESLAEVQQDHARVVQASERASPGVVRRVLDEHVVRSVEPTHQSVFDALVGFLSTLPSLPSAAQVAIDRLDPSAVRAASEWWAELADRIEHSVGVAEPPASFALEPISPLSREAATKRPTKFETEEIEREFDRHFWPLAPKKVDKANAKKAFLKARKDTSVDVILRGIMLYAAQRDGEDPQFTKSPAAWLNGRRWEDEAPTAPRPRQQETRASSAIRGIMSYLDDDGVQP